MSALVPYLPWISLLVALVAIFARDGLSRGDLGERRPIPIKVLAVALFGAALCVLANWKWPGAAGGVYPALAGAAMGVLLSLVAYTVGLLRGQVGAGKTGPIALAALVVSFAELLGTPTILALVFGAAASAWLLSLGEGDDPNPWAMRACIYAGCIVGCEVLAAKATPAVEGLGVFIALAGALSGIIAGAIGQGLSKKDGRVSFVTPVLSLLLFTGGVFLIAHKAELSGYVPMVFLAAAVVAVIVGWVTQDDLPSSSVRVILGSILWIAVATASFGYVRSLGMSIALMAGAGMILLMGNRRALLSLGPLAALVIYRVFRTTHPDTAEAFDIGQHYALMGVLLGVLLPVMAQEWLRMTVKKGGFRTSTSGVLWILLMAAAPVPIAIALSDKGIVGYLIGLGIAPALEGVRGEKSAQSLSLALGLGAAMTLLYDWLQPHLEMDRQGKIVALAWIIGIMVVAAIVIAVLSGDALRKKETSNAQAT